MELKTLYRHSAPTKLDTAEHGTLAVVSYLKDKDVYLQMSNNAEEPRWEFLMNVPLLTTKDKMDELIKQRLTENENGII